MVVKNVVRVGTLFGSALALIAACSGKTVTLNDGHQHDTDGGGATGGSAGHGALDGSAGGSGGGSTGGSGGNVGVEGGAAAPGAGASVTTLPDGAVVVPNKPGIKKSSKLDLLIMVDNSISMADKQRVLGQSIADLVARVTSSGITDLHVGVITSSLGGHGSTSLCVGNDQGSLEDEEMNDHGWLVAKRPRFKSSAGALAPTPDGYLQWTSGENTTKLSQGIADMVGAAGEFGCGLESQLEAAYRFLADPHPYDTIVTQNCPGTTEPCAVPQGIDGTLLAQRRAFLRGDSAVAVVNLTDENDCSIREHGQYYYAARDNIILPHGSSVCAVNPNDKCCYFCSAAPPTDCAPDPSCAAPTPRDQDQPNLRCFHEMQRFGYDFLYPVQRYVNAFSSSYLCTSRDDLTPVDSDCKDSDGDKAPDMFPNPLFFGPTGLVRDPSMVYFLGIVGVPYQDLEKGHSDTAITYQTPAELNTNHTWDVVLGVEKPGNGAAPISPTDGLMIESKDPRGGMDGETPPKPLQGTNAGLLANPVNGHDWVNMDQDDLQYACIFQLPQERDCTEAVMQNPTPGCDCKPDRIGDNNPLCQAADGAYTTNQRFAKAYPSTRELQVVQGLGSNGLAASICARNLQDPQAEDYGYRPAIDLLLKQLGKSIE